jgi:hypothetical protein
MASWLFNQVDIVSTGDNANGPPAVDPAPNGAREAFQYPGQLPNIPTMQSMNDMSGMPGVRFQIGSAVSAVFALRVLKKVSALFQ